MDSTFAKYPFVWLYGEREEKMSGDMGYYDENLCVNVKDNESKTPLILTHPFNIDTRTVTKVIRERDDSDE